MLIVRIQYEIEIMFMHFYQKIIRFFSVNFDVFNSKQPKIAFMHLCQSIDDICLANISPKNKFVHHKVWKFSSRAKTGVIKFGTVLKGLQFVKLFYMQSS